MKADTNKSNNIKETLILLVSLYIFIYLIRQPAQEQNIKVSIPIT